MYLKTIITFTNAQNTTYQSQLCILAKTQVGNICELHANVEAFTSIKGDLATGKKNFKNSLLSEILFQRSKTNLFLSEDKVL